MIKTGGAIYKQLGDWFSQPMPGLLPKNGMSFGYHDVDEFSAFFDPDAQFSMEGYLLDGVKHEDIPCVISCDSINLPLIVAVQSGVASHQLVEIARHHEVNVESLLDTIDSIVITDYPFYDRNGNNIPNSQLCIEIIKAVSIAFPNELSHVLLELQYPAVHLNMASLHSEDPTHWPATRIAAHMKALEAGDDEFPPLKGKYYALNDFKRDSSFDAYLPRDESGPRYDLYLERSGMLLPEVITKKIHPMTLWEDMVSHARVGNGLGLSGLLNYCIDGAPFRFKPSIEKALQSMCGSGKDFFKSSFWQYNFLEKRIKGTWLEAHVFTPMLLINLVSDDDFENVLEKLREQGVDYTYQADDFVDLVKTPNTLNQWLADIMASEPQALGLSHFQIYHLERYQLPMQILSDHWQPEVIILHVLKGLELFVTNDSDQNLPKRQLDAQAFQGCVYVAKTLASRHELDYKAFSGVSSMSIRVLAEAGLDKRRLPRMNNRDKGILVLQEMGL